MKKILLSVVSMLIVATTLYAQSTLGGGICINEFLPDPNGTVNNYDTDNNGTADNDDEFIELYNMSGSSIDITGWELWDKGSGKWFTFPAGTMVQPGGYVVIVLKLTGPGGGLPPVNYGDYAFNANHTGVINNTGDNIVLYDPNNDEYIQLIFNSYLADNPTVAFTGFSSTASMIGSVEDFGADSDGESLTRLISGSTIVGTHTTFSSYLASPGARPCGLVVPLTKQDETCIGSSDGYVNLNPAGGQTPYTYNWSMGATTQSISGLTSGTYFYTVSDGASCDFFSSIYVGAPSSISITFIGTVTESCLGYDGEAHATVSGGVTPYDYWWFDQNWNQVGTQADLLNASGGNYNLQVQDQCFTFDMQNTNIPTDQLNVTVGFGMTSSCGASDGVMNTTVTGGDTPYTYLWTQGQTTASITGMAGINLVTVYDAKGCEKMEGGAIVDPAGITVNMSLTNITCYGDSDGTGSVSVTGGTGPYTITWGKGFGGVPFSNATTVTGLSQDVYLVTVVDAMGCKSFNGGGLDGPWEPLNPKFDAWGWTNINDVSCNGNSDGSAEVNIYQGHGWGSPYNYEWSNGYNQYGIPDDWSYNGSLSAGNYSVTVTDAGGCSQVRAFEIKEPTSITLSIIKHNDDCGNNGGWAQANVSGGTPPYTFSWSNGDWSQTTNNLSAGVFDVTVYDNNSCYGGTQSVTITSTPSMSTNVSTTDATCGANDGTATAVIFGGGTSPYSFIWNNGSTDQYVTGLGSGTAVVTITDSKNCETTSGNFIANPGAPNVNTTSTSVTCPGYNDGSINITVTGTGPFTYQWVDFNGNPVGTTQNLTGLSGGAYILTVSDGQVPSCNANAFVYVNENQMINGNSLIANNNCWYDNNGDIDLGSTYGGDGGPYSYVWSNMETTDRITGLMNGVYNVTISDMSGCSAEASYTITSNISEIFVSVTATDDICATGNGALTAAASGGTGTYQYYWNAGPSGQTHDGMYAGQSDYVWVSDANWTCWAQSMTVTVGGPSNALQVIVSTTDATCGLSDGSASATVTGATPPYTFIWNTGQTATGLTTQTITGLSAGAALITVYDNNGCMGFEGGPINNPGSPTITLAKTNATCYGGDNGKMTANVSGGTTPYTYHWEDQFGNFVGSTATVTGLNAQSLYIVTVTGGDGCSSVDGDMVNSPNQIDMNIWWQQNPTCAGYSNGQAQVQGSGGTGSLSYHWATGTNSDFASNLSGGVNAITITDIKGCSNTFAVTLTDPSAITVTTSTMSAHCGSPDGSATATATGGSGSFNYSWSNGQFSQTANNLLAGTYSVTATDWNGCKASTSATVNNLNGVMITVTTNVDVKCNGGSNGEVTTMASGGTTPYIYTWSDMSTISGVTSATLTGQMAGTVSVTVEDNNGCAISASSVVSQPSVLMASTTVTHPTTIGGNNGTGTMIVSGGTTPYSYLWHEGTTTSTITGLSAGGLGGTVTDANSCTAFGGNTLIDPSCDLVLSPTTTSTTCNGASDGSTYVSASMGVTPYTYLWEMGNTIAGGGLQPAGTYSVTVTDAVNCVKTAIATVTEPTAMSITMTPSDASCNGGSDGEIIVGGNGGTGNVTFLWSSGQTTLSISGLTIGTYTLTATDQNGCTVSGTENVGEPTALSLSVTSTMASCGISDGSATANVSGGVTPYSYMWSNGNTTMTANNISAGNYSVTVSDANVCTTNGSTVVSNPGGPGVTVMLVSDAMCNGSADGALTAIATGGQSPYTYLWNDAQTASTAVGLGAGTYSVDVIDVNSCMASASGTITEPSMISVTPSSTPVSCSGGNDGTMGVMASGGVSPYTYMWDNGMTVASASVVTAGVYAVTVYDNNMCEVPVLVSVSEPMAVSISVTSTDPICKGSNDGTAMVNVTGGTMPYNYTWSVGKTISSIVGLPAGVVSVTVEDANGCTETGSTTLTDPMGMTAMITATDAACGASDGTATVIVTNGTLPYTYAWNVGATDASISGLSAGFYGVDVYDANNCLASASAPVQNIGAPSMSVTVVSDVNCNGGSNGELAIVVSGGTSPYSFMWDDAMSQTTQNAIGLVAGNYGAGVLDGAGCLALSSGYVAQPEKLVASISAMDANCNGASDGSAQAMVMGGTSPYAYLWSNGDIMDMTTGLIAGSVSVTITDQNLCQTDAMGTVNEPTMLSITTSATAETVDGANDGMASVGVTGGNSMYTFNWSNGATDASISGLSDGPYSVTVMDNGMCSEVAMVTVDQGMLLCSISLTTSSNDENCGHGDGSASVIASGTGSSYTYNWNNGETVNSIYDLSIGIYSVTVSSNDGCTDMASVTVGGTAGVDAHLETTDATCGNSDGSAMVTVTGAATPFTYEWSDLNGNVVGGNSASVTGLSFGAIFISVSDANGCSNFEGGPIAEAGAPTITITSTDVTCNGLADGTITAEVSGGTGPFTYKWALYNFDNSTSTPLSETTSAISGLAANQDAEFYLLTVTGSDGCSALEGSDVRQPDAISVTMMATSVTSAGASDGSATVMASGGANGSFSYDWSNGGTTNMISGLSGSFYTVTVTDDNGCMKTGGVAVDEPGITITPPCDIAVSLNGTNVTTNGGNDGSATAVVTGDYGVVTYAWSVAGTTNMISGLTAGVYTVTVTDDITAGCTATDVVTITEPAAVSCTLSISVSQISDTELAVNVSGGQGNVSYLWETGATNDTIVPGVSYLFTYVQVTVTDDIAAGCQLVDSVFYLTSSIEKFENNINISAYPNPNSGQFTVAIEGNGSYTMSVLNVIGQVIDQGRFAVNGKTTQSIDLTNEESGVYFVKVSHEGYEKVIRIIVSK